MPSLIDTGPDWFDGAARIPSELGADAAARFDAELLRFQRRRCMAYCVGSMALMAVIVILDIWALVAGDWEAAESLVDVIDPVFDSFLLAVYGGFLLAFRATSGPRARIITLLHWLLSIVGVTVILAAMVVWIPLTSNDPTAHPTSPLIVAGGTSITIVFLIHFLASLFIALSPKEGLMPLLPITVAYVAGILLLVPGPGWLKAVMIALWPLAGGPGYLWSVWRYGKFVDAFRWRTVTGRYRDIRQDLSDARRVHESLLPAPIREGRFRLDYRYEPMRDIGGDYFFVHGMGHGDLLLVVVDVAGHGVGSALAASRIHGELERLVEDRTTIGPAEVLVALNRFTHRALAKQGIFASAIAVLLRPSGDLVYANAGHPPILVRELDGALRSLDSTATLLGVLDKTEFDAGETTAPLPKGACVVLYTDGVTEARSASGELFGDSRTEAVVRDAGVGGADRIAPALVEEIARYRAGEPTDDVLVVALWRQP